MENIEKKLDNLLKLQEIDSKIFELKQVRGALPWRAPFFKLKPPLTISSFKSKLPSKSRYFVFSKDRAGRIETSCERREFT